MRMDEASGKGIERLDDDLAQSARMAAAFEGELSRLRQSMAYTSREVGSLTSGLESGLRRAFDGLIFDGGKLSDALRGVGRALVDSVYGIAMRPIEGALASGLAGMVTGAMTPFAAGGAFQQGRVTAVGGDVVGQATGFPMRGGIGLLGEAGAEAIMPLRRGADGRLGVAAAGGGRAVNVTFNISTPDVAGFQRSQSQIAAQMSRLMAQGERNN
ncbi:phage tail tape measure protein, lambda family [Paracoccus tibetensis]|uniref:Phage tail tape measure protein, lambda family n=2 Tax=Paracoccus tibetensis TaxID=336292 RepID=A0A1G5H3Q6_9RHOB|nr:phage tail tape measure protein, lambda family [Paracoccus tibetensis]